MATQLGDLLSNVLLDLSTDFTGGGFMLMAWHGQMMNYTVEGAEKQLEVQLRGTGSVSTVLPGIPGLSG